jgi:hypothetical protein
VDDLATLEVGHDAPAVLAPDAGHLLAKPESRALGSHLVREGFDDLAVDEVQKGRPLLDHRHRHAERGEHRGELQADDSRADDDQGPGDLRPTHRVVDDEDPLAIERDVGVADRAGPAGDQHVARRQSLWTRRALHFEGVWIFESRSAADECDPIAPELPSHDRHLALDDGENAALEVRD